MTSNAENIQKVLSLYNKWGAVRYEGEDVTQLEHALQTAQQAEIACASISVILAAFFHDIGHLVSMDSNAEEKWSLENHGKVGKEYLAEHGFSSDVVDLVAGHVNAKRFLVFKHQNYYEKLSKHSRYTLKLQGGAMDSEEASTFEKHSQFNDIIRLREWDEQAKMSNKKTEDLNYYSKLCEQYFKNK